MKSVAGQYFARFGKREHRTRGQLRWRWCLVLVLLACCGTLPLSAAASPPDPTWVPGFYDDADYDDVIGLLTNTAAVRELQLETAAPVSFGFRPLLGGSASLIPDALLLGFRLRSPPTI